MAVGALSSLGLIKEAVFGTPLVPTVFPPFTSESFKDGPEAISEPQIRALLSMDPKYKGMLMVSGGFSGIAYPSQLGHLIRAALGPDTVTGTGPFVHTFVAPQVPVGGIAKADLPPYSISVNRNAIQCKRYISCVCTKLGLKFAQGGALTYDTSWIGQNTDSISPPTVVLPTDTPFTLTASISRGGSTDATIQDFSIDISNTLEGVKTINNSNLIDSIRFSGKRSITFSGTADFSTSALYDQFILFTSQLWIITFTQGTSTLAIEIPAGLITDAGASVGGDGRITLSFSGEGQYDTSTSRDLRMVLTNSVATY